MGLGFGAALCVGLLTAPSEAAVSWNLKPSGTGNWDWNFRGIYQKYEESDGAQELPYTLLVGFMWHNAADHCIEVATGPGRATANPDTRIWVRSGPSGAWQSVNDDYGGTLQSKARVWIQFPSTFEGQYHVKFAPFHFGYVNQDFELITTRRDLTEAQCTTDQTIPWVKIIGNGTFENTIILSPNAT